MPNLPRVHRPKWAERVKRKAAVERAKHTQKGRCFKTSHRTWRKIRATVLQREPLCRHCAEQGITTTATDVDHIDGNTFDNTDANLQPLCKPCHTRKTVREQRDKR